MCRRNGQRSGELELPLGRRTWLRANGKLRKREQEGYGWGKGSKANARSWMKEQAVRSGVSEWWCLCYCPVERSQRKAGTLGRTRTSKTKMMFSLSLSETVMKSQFCLPHAVAKLPHWKVPLDQRKKNQSHGHIPGTNPVLLSTVWAGKALNDCIDSTGPRPESC